MKFLGNKRLCKLSVERYFLTMKKYILEKIKKGEQIIFFGGDHASTSVIWSNIIQTDKEMAVIIFDAHNDYGDTVNGYYNTNILDHAERYFK